MENTTQALLNLLERILGNGDKKSRGNYAFKCPNNCHITKKKLEINLETQEWKCWICHSTEKMTGKKISTLFKKIGVSDEYLNELKLIIPSIKSKPTSWQTSIIQFPKEFKPINFNPDTKTLEGIFINKALIYLKNRGITKQDILKYNIGICLEGKYENRVIIPSYDSLGRLNYFIARDFTETQDNYKNPPVKNKDIIGMELYINWNLPIILCEGIFDFLTIKRNCIPLFGKTISEALMKKIVTSQVQKIYLALDKDAIKDSLKYCEELMKIGKEVYLVEMDGKDINSIGFKHFLEILENTNPLTFQELVIKKLEL